VDHKKLLLIKILQSTFWTSFGFVQASIFHQLKRKRDIVYLKKTTKQGSEHITHGNINHTPTIQ